MKIIAVKHFFVQEENLFVQSWLMRKYLPPIFCKSFKRFFIYFIYFYGLTLIELGIIISVIEIKSHQFFIVHLLKSSDY